MTTKLARFTRTCVALAKKATAGTPGPAVKIGDGGYADWVMIAVHGLKEHLGHSYRQLMDVLHEMPRIRGMLGLHRGELPHYSTVCHAKEQLYMPTWRTFLAASTHLLDLGEIQAIDASGFDRIAASRKYAKRTNYTFKAMKTTLLVDCDTNAILDVHWSSKQPHDTQIGRRLLRRNLEKITVVTADKGYDDDSLRHWLRDNGIRPVIKHREFSSLDKAHNARLDEEVYHQRSMVETAFFAMKQRFGDGLAMHKWYNQVRELVLRCAINNIENHVKESG